MADELDPRDLALAKVQSDMDRLTRRLMELAQKPYVEIDELTALRQRLESFAQRVNAGDGFERVFDAQITGFNPTSGTAYSWKEMYVTSGDNQMVPFADGRSALSYTSASYAIELNRAAFIASGTNVRMIQYPGLTRDRFVFQAPAENPFQRVKIAAQVGGSNGTATTVASYTYNVTDFYSGAAVSGGPFSVKDSETSRCINGNTTPAANGTEAYLARDNGGNPLYLIHVEEFRPWSACS